MGLNQEPDELTKLKKKIQWLKNQIDIASKSMNWLESLIDVWACKLDRLQQEYNKKWIDESAKI